MVLQGGVASKTRTCPLQSDAKAIHEEAVAKAAEEAREKLKQEKITLDIDPLQGIGPTKEKLRQELLQRCHNLKAEVRFQNIVT